MNQHYRTICWSVIVSLALLAAAGEASAQTTIAIDGSFADWAGKAAQVDPGGQDDEASPARADITESRSFADAAGLYLTMAWDNTSFTGGQATTAGLTIRSGGNTFYRIYTTANGNPASVALSTLDINSCTNASCGTQNDVCAGAACSGALAGSGVNWVDPFGGRASPACSGTNCGTVDAAIELFIPWSLLGGAPTSGQYTFIQFGSYPSGPAQAPKDETGANGVACLNTGSGYQCYPATPTAIDTQAITAGSPNAGRLALAAAVLASLLGAALMGLRRRKGVA